MILASDISAITATILQKNALNQGIIDHFTDLVYSFVSISSVAMASICQRSPERTRL